MPGTGRTKPGIGAALASPPAPSQQLAAAVPTSRSALAQEPPAGSSLHPCRSEPALNRAPETGTDAVICNQRLMRVLDRILRSLRGEGRQKADPAESQARKFTGLIKDGNRFFPRS